MPWSARAGCTGRQSRRRRAGSAAARGRGRRAAFRIEHELHTFVLKSRTSVNREDLIVDDRFAEDGLELSEIRLLSFEEVSKCYFIVFNNAFDELSAILLSICAVFLRHLPFVNLFTHVS